MKVRKTTKRLKTDEWRPWQIEEYVGCHEVREWVPADDADPRGYQFRPCFLVQSPPVDQSRYRTPQLAMYMPIQEERRSIWERIKKWAAT